MMFPFSARDRAHAPPHVGEARRTVGQGRHCVWFALLCMLASAGACAPSPDQLLVGRWRESHWRYEKLGSFERGSLPSDRADPALPALLRHEAEHWEFRPDGALVVSGEGGARRVGRWKLKGRGHLLLLEGIGLDQPEVYQIKQLRDGQLVLDYDIGLEVRGIARLTFARVDGAAPPTALAAQQTERSN